MDLNEARKVWRDPGVTGEEPEYTAAEVMAERLDAIEKLCDQPVNAGTPWWVFRDAVREILKG